MNTWICIGYFDIDDGKRMYKLQNPDTMEEKTVCQKAVKDIKNILNLRFENGYIRVNSLAQSRYNSKNDRDRSEQALNKFTDD